MEESGLTTEELFRGDAYLEEAPATVTLAGEGWVELDRTVFYPTGGGQPGDQGRLVLADGTALTVIDTRKGEAPGRIRHLLDPAAPLPGPGTAVTASLDFARRHRLMRAHSALHLLSKPVGGVVTGGQVGEAKGRLDFDIPEPKLDKEALTAQLMQWVALDRPITAWWIDDAEFDRRTDLVRTMSVSPPRGQGRVRLVEMEGLDLQACGGTHVRSTGEIGGVRVEKIEKKGRQNRRVGIVLE
jgi:misacylated tRNA(Ala) deacylase